MTNLEAEQITNAIETKAGTLLNLINSGRVELTSEIDELLE